MAAQPSDLHQRLTARRFARPSPLFRWCDEVGLFDQPGHALVFGAGLLTEVDALLARGWTVDALETRASLEARRSFYDDHVREAGRLRLISDLSQSARLYRVITVTHVLEFIPTPLARQELLDELGRRLSKKGHLLLSLRGWSDVNAAKNKRPLNDGFVTGLGTWTRGYTMDEAHKLVDAAGLVTHSSPHSRMAVRPEQVRLVCRRKDAN